MEAIAKGPHSVEFPSSLCDPKLLANS
jgi:hypothetical protein